jgi:obg-like ATPase 1
MGIVGFPNVGKSSTFNLLSKLQVKAENFCFCTIDPTVAKVPVADERFDFLISKHKPKSRVPATLTVYDIAGLVRGAHKGDGLGNSFLSHIQAVDGIYHLVRAFDDEAVAHHENDVNPIRDLEVICEELVMKDLEILGKRIDDLKHKIERFNDDKAIKEMELCQKIKKFLDEKKWIKDQEWAAREIDFLNEFRFFTAKPVVYLVNISERDFKRKKNKYLPKINDWIKTNCPGKMIPYSVTYEQNQANSGEEAKGPSMIDKIINTGYDSLDLIRFFTAGPDEVRGWTVRKNSKAPKAAGVIHTDFEKGFICAEVMKYADFKELGSEQKVKGAGKYRQNGREYVVEDGDIIFFKFNVSKSKKKK